MGCARSGRWGLVLTRAWVVVGQVVALGIADVRGVLRHE
jgi:hypothetical protein